MRRSFRTSILASRTGSEQRSRLRTLVTRCVVYALDQTSAGLSNYVRRKLFSYLHLVMGVPLWTDVAVLSAEAASGQAVIQVDSTQYKAFEDGERCVILSADDPDSYEVGTIQSHNNTSITLTGNLVNTWASGLEVYPIIKCRLATGQKISALTASVDHLEIEAIETHELAVTTSTTTTSTTTTTTSSSTSTTTTAP